MAADIMCTCVLFIIKLHSWRRRLKLLQQVLRSTNARTVKGFHTFNI